MTIEFHCPNCQKLLRTRDDKAGSKAKCPGCGEPVSVPSAGDAPEDPIEDFDDGAEEYDWGGTEESFPPPGMIACPMCGESISARASACPHCGEAVGYTGGAGTRRRRGGNRERIRQRVQAPAISLMVVAGLGIAIQLAGVVMNLMGIAVAAPQANQAMEALFSGAIGVVMGGLEICIGVVMLLGAIQMQKLGSHGFALAAAILGMVPCLSPCCLLGLPVGIWAMTVLNDTEVKAAFSS